MLNNGLGKGRHKVSILPICTGDKDRMGLFGLPGRLQIVTQGLPPRPPQPRTASMQTAFQKPLGTVNIPNPAALGKVPP
jgi:hypothetical protein